MPINLKYTKLDDLKKELKIIHFNDCYQIQRTPYFLEKIK